jgi:hypothetical protein
MRRFASCALLAATAGAAAGCAGSHVRVVSSRPAGQPAGHLLGVLRDRGPENRIGPGPFRLGGGWVGGAGNGLWGDGSTGPQGTILGCLDHRRYSDAVGLKNKTKAPVTLTAAIGPNPAPGIIDRVAVQLRLSPPYHPTEVAPVDLVYRRWSAAPTGPVTIPPGRIVTVQRNYSMRDCSALRPGRTLTVPGSLLLRYRKAGHAGRQKLTLPSERIVVRSGPTRRQCIPVAGSASLVASDVSCAFARRAAPACRAMKNGGWAGCKVAGALWDCGRFAGPGYPLLETCYLPREKSHWFSVVWIGRGLGLWGAIADRRANKGWRRIDAWRTTRGACVVRIPHTLIFESNALRILHGRAGARVATDARVKLVIRGYHGSGSYPASVSVPPGVQIETAVRVAIGRRGATSGSYVATAGRVRIVRATNGSISGMVYANLLDEARPSRANLNGTWSCRIAKQH